MNKKGLLHHQFAFKQAEIVGNNNQSKTEQNIKEKMTEGDSFTIAYPKW